MKKIYLTESELVRLISNVINEQQMNPLFNIAIPQLIFQGNPQNQKQIVLSGTYTDSNGNLKKELLKYNVAGSLGLLSFDVNLKNFQRAKNGGLYVEAQPDNSVVKSAVATLIPKNDLTKDGYIISYVSPEQLQGGINQLKKNSGASAEVDAGHGVKLRLTYAR